MPDIGQDFNKFADEIAFRDPSTPAAPRVSLTQNVVTTRTIGFPPSKFFGQQREPDEDTMPAETLLGCCLYPWPTADGSLYPTTDLPDSIFSSLLSVTYTRNGVVPTDIIPVLRASFSAGSYYITDPIGSGSTLQIGTISSDYNISDPEPLFGWTSLTFVSLDGGTHWNFSGLFGSPPCLIQDDIFDFFHTTYMVNGLDTITRGLPGYTPCQWTGAKTGGGRWLLDYGNFTAFKFNLNGNSKDPPQSDPTGIYGPNTVS